MTITIDDSKTKGLVALAARQNPPVTPEDYLTARVEDILSSYDAAEVQRIKDENDQFFALAAQLPQADQDEVRTIVLTKAALLGITPPNQPNETTAP